MNVNKVILFLPLLVVSTISILLSYGFFATLNLKIIPIAISSFSLYLIFRDLEFDKKLQGCERRIKDQNGILEKIHADTFPVELISESEALEKWMKFEKMISAYNAPWTLADNKLYPAFKQFLQNEDVKLRILLFDGKSRQQKKRIYRKN